MFFWVLAAYSMVVPLTLIFLYPGPKINKWVSYFLFLGLINTIITTTLAYFGIITVASNTIFIPLQFYFISQILSADNKEKINLKLFFLFSLAIVFEGFLGGFDSFPSATTSLTYLMIVFVSIRENLRLIKSNTNYGYKIELQGKFWINNSIFVFFSGILLITLFTRYLQIYHLEILVRLWSINSILILIFYGMLSYGIWLTKRVQD